jgi:DNA-binding ferritin-like protein (Dps family)
VDITKLISKVIGEKGQWREYKARKQRLPENYREALDAAQRYSYYSGLSDGETVMRMLGDLLDLFEQGAANGTPIRDLIGDDPVAFMDEFLENYKKGDWKAPARDRLTDAVRHAADEHSVKDTKDEEGTR